MTTQLTEKSRVLINPFWSGNGAACGEVTAFVILPDKDEREKFDDASEVLNYKGEMLFKGICRPRYWIRFMAALYEAAKVNFTIVEVDRFGAGGPKVKERDVASWLSEVRSLYPQLSL